MLTLRPSYTQPLNSLVPPQEEKVTTDTRGKRTCSSTATLTVILTPPYQLSPNAEWTTSASRPRVLPLDLSSDADPARDKALADSVRGGFVDDVGVEESRRIFDTDKLLKKKDV